MNFFQTASLLSKAGVAGINMRNANYTLIYNQRSSYPLVDDKALTKELAAEFGINIPETYALLEVQRHVRDFHAKMEGREDFVIKPSRGSGGDGIVIISGKAGKYYKKLNGDLVDPSDIEHHLSKIVSGMFSLGGYPDRALVESRVRFDPVFKKISYQGIPDIRVIVFLGVPVMAMVRLPTKMSDGKANLHQGAIGAGISIASGTTLGAVWKNEIIEIHPDTNHPVSGIVIPHWKKILKIASSCYDMTGMGYLGVDLVLDEARGPLMLELNARPGLNIQIANGCGILGRLEKVKAHAEALTDSKKRVSFALKEFA